MSVKKKQIRAAFRKAVFERDGHRCRVCDKFDDDISLDAHHIINRNLIEDGGYELDNGISLCPSCHLKAEKFHQTNGAIWEIGYHPDDLKKLIS